MLNLADMFGKLQQMQESMQKVRQSLDTITVEAEAGGGMVRVTANANKRIIKIKVDKEVMNDAEMMEDLVTAAVNKALDKAEEAGRAELQKITSGMLPNIPGMDLSKLGL
jgi:DNA-binding YbaB/EbfC family protein